MKYILFDLERCLKGKWFWIASAASVLCLWLGMGEWSYTILSGGYANDLGPAMEAALTGEINLALLPVLSALPFSAAAYSQLKSGVFRFFVFRGKVGSYLRGKLLANAAGAVFSQLLAVLVLAAALRAWPGRELLLSRLLLAVFYSCIGMIASLAGKDTVLAYIAPVAANFAMTMLVSRFLTFAWYLNPEVWLKGGILIVPVLGTAFAMLAAGLLLRKELKKYG